MQGITRFFTAIVQKYLPDPFVFAIILSIIVFVLSILATPNSPSDILTMWGSGFWNLLAFTMQMVLVVVTGHALASSDVVKGILTRFANIPNNPTQGVMLVTFVGSVACIINWGFGLIIGAMLAKEVAKRVDKSDYPLLIACAYIAFLVWHGGFSGSIPLLAATPGNPVEKICGLIPINDTLFTSFNLVITGTLIVCLPFLTAKMLPRENERKFINPELLKDESSSIKRIITKDTPLAIKIEESRVLALLVGVAGLGYILMTWLSKGFKLDINSVNLLFLALGIILHKTPMAYARAISLATKSTAGIIVQFPFYAGIQAMLEHSGLGGIITDFFIQIADKHTFPLFAFLSSAIINFAIPSGGGHWVVQGPFIMSAAKSLGADSGHAVMAIAYGEAWMNMAQPFWALPALAIAGLGARDIMGYCLITLFLSGIVFVGGLMLL